MHSIVVHKYFGFTVVKRHDQLNTILTKKLNSVAFRDVTAQKEKELVKCAHFSAVRAVTSRKATEFILKFTV